MKIPILSINIVVLNFRLLALKLKKRCVCMYVCMYVCVGEYANVLCRNIQNVYLP